MNQPCRAALWVIVTTALSLSVGWGIRGNFGHEYGAMIPGALASMAGTLLCERSDWWPRVAFFGFFGALGWSLGGSMSYMQVIAYTHSGHSSSVLYGFACLFLLGFLWAAMGGAGSALPACLSRKELSGFIPALTAVFAAWTLQDLVVGILEHPDSQFRQASVLYWYDTDWLAALTALLAVAALALWRRRVDLATSLIVHIAAGWWVGFLLLVVTLGWRMTPPRGDNWAGCLGMVAGLWVFLHRSGLKPVTAASLITGFVGGFGFATATLFKLLEVKSGLETNWHSVLEQTYGLMNGLGLALALLYLARTVKPAAEQPPASKAADIYTVAFLLLVITYVNLSKNPAVWIQAKAMPTALYGVSAAAWFNVGYGALAAMLLALLVAHQRQPIALVPQSALGKGQLLYVLFLWRMVLGNFDRALVGFAPPRLITEGVIHLNAVLCTLLVLLPNPVPCLKTTWAFPMVSPPFKRIVVIGTIAALLSVGADWALVRAVYGDQFAGHAALHIRFGPHATATGAKPKPNQPHP